MKPHKITSHLQAQELINKSRDGALDDEQRKQLAQHLEGCSECRAYAAALAQLDGQLQKSLQARWPESHPKEVELSSALADILPRFRKNQMKINHSNTLRSLGWGALTILLIVGLVWTLKTLAPLPNQAPSVQVLPVVATVSVTEVIVRPIQKVSPEVQATYPASVSPMAGKWAAVTDFGKLIFTIEELPSRITHIDYLFSDWTCGSITQSSEIVDATSWLITANQFVAYSTFDKNSLLTMVLKGTFDPTNQEISGTWEEASAGTICSGTWQAAAPAITTTLPPPTGVTSLFPGVVFNFASGLPSSPESLTVYRQQLSDAVTVESARQVANQWGVAGGVYSSPSEGMGDVIYDVIDGARMIRFLNFPDQFIYAVGYASPDYGSALMDNGPLPSFDEQVSIATKFLEPLGILDLPYRAMPMETERGMVAFMPLLDGYPVIQEIGVDRSNIGWIDAKVSAPGWVTMVEYSHKEFQPVGAYPVLTASQAWDRFTQDASLQHSRYAVLSPAGENTYQAWVHKYQPGQPADIYGWINSYQPADSNSLPMVMINNLPIIGDISGMLPDNQYDVRFIHAWGQVQGSSTDGIALQVTGWEISTLTDQYITGTLTTKSGQVQLVALDRTYDLVDPPAGIPDGTQVGIQAVVLEGTPSSLNWKFIETGQIPFSYGASNSCGGGGGGGSGLSNANFGTGTFAHLNLDNQDQPTPTQADQPYQPGDAISSVSGRVYITQHIYLGGTSSTEVVFTPNPSSGLVSEWSYSLIGDKLSGIDQYNNLPVLVSGQVDHLENNIVYINVTNYQPVYPGEQIQAWTGTEQILTLDGQSVVLFTTSAGDSYVLKSSMDYPPADANIIGRLGDLIEIEGYIIPDQQLGGYLLLQDTAGTTQPDGVADSAQVSIWNHTQDPSTNPGMVLQGTVTIDNVELAYDAINLDRCQASAATDPNLAPWLYVQPMWVFTGHFDDGRRFIAQVQALPDEYLK